MFRRKKKSTRETIHGALRDAGLNVGRTDKQIKERDAALEDISRDIERIFKKYARPPTEEKTRHEKEKDELEKWSESRRKARNEWEKMERGMLVAEIRGLLDIFDGRTPVFHGLREWDTKMRQALNTIDRNGAISALRQAAELIPKEIEARDRELERQRQETKRQEEIEKQQEPTRDQERQRQQYRGMDRGR